MAYTISANFEPTTDGNLIWKLKELLVAAGWVIRSSGDGTTFNGSGDVHAPGGPYVSSLDNANAWFCIRAPVPMSPRREFVFQRPNTSHGVWRAWYSSDGTGFTGGTPNATTRPTAADESGVLNTPSGTSAWIGSFVPVRSYRADFVIGGSGELYGWYMQVRKTGRNNAHATMFFDPLTDVSTGDTDGAVVGMGGFVSSDTTPHLETAGMFSTTDSQTVDCVHGWYKKGLSGATWVNFPVGVVGLQTGTGNQWNSLLNNNPPSMDVNGKLPSFPVIYMRGGSALSTQKGWKGTSTLFRYDAGTIFGTRPYADKSRWIMGCLSIPWDGSTEIAF